MERIDATRNRGMFEVVAGTDRSQAASMTLEPGRSTGGPDNRHEDSDQWLYVVSGHGTATVDGKAVDLEPGVLLLIAAAAFRLMKREESRVSGFDAAADAELLRTLHAQGINRFNGQALASTPKAQSDIHTRTRIGLYFLSLRYHCLPRHKGLDPMHTGQLILTVLCQAIPRLDRQTLCTGMPSTTSRPITTH